ncbi:MAG: glutamate synthase [Clostridia bacterium]|nr:glutamate synthase [Clostridia bacterium]
MRVKIRDYSYKEINELLRQGESEYFLTGCMGQCLIAAGMSGIEVVIQGRPGNGLGAYLNGAKITVMDNASDAVGDTMNDGEIIVFGNVGDSAGYAMRGGKIFVERDADYRAGIHMKAYRDKVPLLVIGGRAGSFLGEYQAGGVIVVLGLTAEDDERIVGHFPCTGMHGGKIILRSDCRDVVFPEHVTARAATLEDTEEIKRYVSEYCELFGADRDEIMNSPFTVVTPLPQSYKRFDAEE